MQIPTKFVRKTLPISLVSQGLALPLDLSVSRVGNEFCDAIAAWLRKTPSPNTTKSYAGDLSQFFRFLGLAPHESGRLAEVRPIHVSAWRDQLKQNGMANATIRRKLTTLRALFSYLQNCGLVAINPAHGKFVTAPPVPRDGKTVGLSQKACRLLIDAPNPESPLGVRDRAILAVLAYSACRVDEVVHLRVQDYLQTGEHRVLNVIGKGQKERRVPLHVEAVERLNAWLFAAGILHDRVEALFRPVRTARGSGKQGFQRCALTTRSVAKLVKKYALQVGLDPAVSVHSLRVTALTIARERGADIIDLQDFAGHADPRTTLTYIRSRDRLSKSPAYILNY